MLNLLAFILFHFQFDLGCQDWLRALAGTLNSVGTLLVLPITGYISDRFGRRFALVISVLNLGTIGLIRAFSVNYTMYLILQIMQTTLGAGTYSTAYIFGNFLYNLFVLIFRFKVFSYKRFVYSYRIGWSKVSCLHKCNVIFVVRAWSSDPWLRGLADISLALITNGSAYTLSSYNFLLLDPL